MTSETAVKKNIQKLQRAIVDGLEDVKGQDIQVFNTEKLSPLFERVIVASGTSNRQTKALAMSVADAVREAGFDKPRMEGEDNGEWIIVDCGQAVVHVMQPTIRQYYRLEEIWGESPVRMKSGAEKAKAARASAENDRVAAARKPVAKLKQTTAKADASRSEAAAKPKPVKSKASSKPAAAPAAKKAVAAKKPAARKTTGTAQVAAKAPAKKTSAKVATVKVGVPAKKAAAKPAAKPVAKKAPAKAAAKSASKPAGKTAKPKAKA